MLLRQVLRSGYVFLFLALGFSRLALAQEQKTGDVVITVSHWVGEARLRLDSVIYKNSLDQDFTVSKFRYYIGGMILKRADGKQFRSPDYFLVDEEEEASKQLVLHNVPDGIYQSFEFMIGVDSLDNCSGARSGALDPIHAMFWTWRTGYIFLKMEGSSSFSHSPGHLLEYHIGGYQQPDNCIRRISLSLGNVSLKGNRKMLAIKADLQQLLKDPEAIDFEKLPAVTDFRNAVRIANNYKNMFVLDHRGL